MSAEHELTELEVKIRKLIEIWRKYARQMRDQGPGMVSLETLAKEKERMADHLEGLL